MFKLKLCEIFCIKFLTLVPNIATVYEAKNFEILIFEIEFEITVFEITFLLKLIPQNNRKFFGNCPIWNCRLSPIVILICVMGHKKLRAHLVWMTGLWFFSGIFQFRRHAHGPRKLLHLSRDSSWPGIRFDPVQALVAALDFNVLDFVFIFFWQTLFYFFKSLISIFTSLFTRF